MRAHVFFASLVLWTGLAIAQSDSAEVTDDGLVRVPSTPKAGVFRLPVATFNHYQRVLFDPVKVAFKEGWEKNHREMTARDIEGLRADLARTYRGELRKELVDRGGFQVAKEPGPDVLRVAASIVDTDVIAPKASTELAQKTFVSSAGSMRTIVELHDSASGVLIARIISYESAPERNQDLKYELQRQQRSGFWPSAASPITNMADFRLGFANSARYTHEAIAVAKSEYAFSTWAGLRAVRRPHYFGGSMV